MTSRRQKVYDLLAVARPPLAPAAFFCAVVPPWLVVLRRVPEPDALPPRLDAPGELAIFAARSFDIPLSFSASYCFSFLTLARLPGTGCLLTSRSPRPCGRLPSRCLLGRRPPARGRRPTGRPRRRGACEPGASPSASTPRRDRG